jgi:hypothetical protein
VEQGRALLRHCGDSRRSGSVTTSDGNDPSSMGYALVSGGIVERCEAEVQQNLATSRSSIGQRRRGVVQSGDAEVRLSSERRGTSSLQFGVGEVRKSGARVGHSVVRVPRRIVESRNGDPMFGNERSGH